MPVSLCKQCGYRWNHPQRIPKYCPSCKSTDWDIDPVEEGDSCEIAGCVCDLCGCKFFTGILQAHHCPNCGSKEWDKGKRADGTKFDHKCLRCNYEWSSKIKAPKACPKCNSHIWSVPKNGTKFVCKQCGHEWNSMLDHIPEKCPSQKCQSRKWR